MKARFGAVVKLIPQRYTYPGIPGIGILGLPAGSIIIHFRRRNLFTLIVGVRRREWFMVIAAELGVRRTRKSVPFFTWHSRLTLSSLFESFFPHFTCPAPPGDSSGTIEGVQRS